MVFLYGLLATLALCLQAADAQTWHFLRYWAPSGSQFTSLSGTMVVPTLPRAGTYYLWPGLQPTDGTGVYQNVLDGRSGTWWIGSGWCCSNPSLPWGSGFNINGGDSVQFNNVLGSDTWTSTLRKTSDGSTVSNNFALAGKSFNQALFAIELYGVSWDFGALEFRDVTITATGSDSSWCNSSPSNYNNAAVVSISGVRASVRGGGVTCTISRLVLERAA